MVAHHSQTRAARSVCARPAVRRAVVCRWPDPGTRDAAARCAHGEPERRIERPPNGPPRVASGAHLPRTVRVVFVQSFPPIARRDARVLILGTMPGIASLAARQYYAHARNAFWPILAAICGFAADAPYRARCAALRACGIAVWDVLAACTRPGSLDSDIDVATMEPHDFAGFFASHRRVRAVVCNGGTAGVLFARRVQPRLPEPARSLPVLRVPSTSPAHAGRSFAAKLDAWRTALLPLLRSPDGQ
jgi:TDG/mug DNA glycosylase family protein